MIRSHEALIGGKRMEQKRLIKQIINESLKELENKCPEKRATLEHTGGFRIRNNSIHNAHIKRSILADRRIRNLIFKLDAKIGFADHRKLKLRPTTKLINFKRERLQHRDARIWRQILDDYIQDSGVSLRTKNPKHDGRRTCDNGLIRITQYRTEKQRFGSLLYAFSHQRPNLRMKRPKYWSINSIILFQNEALALSYAVARSLGLESEFHSHAIQNRAFNRDLQTTLSKKKIRDAASQVLTELISRYRSEMR